MTLKMESKASLMAINVRRIAVATAGFCVLACGVALIVVPVPGTTVVVLPLGLAILAKEFDWARRLLDWSRTIGRRLWAETRRLLGRSVPPMPVPC